MGSARPPQPAKLVVGMLSASADRLHLARKLLEGRFGSVDYAGDFLPFEQTDYYVAELGAPLARQFLAFEPLFQVGDLAQAKLTTNSLEAELSLAGSRTVNLDPGYVTAAKLVLATTRDNSHRVYIGEGIYAEVTLRFVRGRFEPWPWTYPDYASPAVRAVFERIRALYMAQARRRRDIQTG